MKPKLYVILGSHACRTGILLMEHKGIEYERVELPTGFQSLMLRLRGFSGNPRTFRLVDGRTPRMLAPADRMGTVPSLEMNGERVKTNREIARFLDRVQPDPPLFPSDPDHRRAVEDAERWGDEVFQMTARRLALTGSLHGIEWMQNGGDDGRLGPLLWRRRGMRRVGLKVVARAFDAKDGDAEARLLESLAPQLDQIDSWIEDGLLNGPALYAADYMIVTSLALLSYRPDVRAEIERRSSLALLDRVLPDPAAASQSVAA
jgi:glutathione S-transferase